MRCASIKTLTTNKINRRVLSVAEAKEIRKIFAADADELDLIVMSDARYTSVARIYRQELLDIRYYKRDKNRLMLLLLDVVCGTYGIEYVKAHKGRGGHYYLNAGDTYEGTLIYSVKNDSLFIGCWGTLVGG